MCIYFVVVVKIVIGYVKLYGWFYNIEIVVVICYDEELGKFVLMSEIYVEEMLVISE